MGRGESIGQFEEQLLPENDPSAYPCPFCSSENTEPSGSAQHCQACGEHFDLDAVAPAAEQVKSAGEIVAYVQELHANDEDWSEGNLEERIYAHDSYCFVEAVSLAPFLHQWSFDDDTVDEYTFRSTPFPAIIVGADEELIDGQHRVLAAESRGDKTISAWVAVR